MLTLIQGGATKRQRPPARQKTPMLRFICGIPPLEPEATVRQVAEAIGVSPGTVRRWMRTYGLRYRKTSRRGQYKIPISSVTDLLAALTFNPGQPN